MTRILFIFPIIREEDEPKHFPLGMSICAAVAKQEGAKVAFYDMNAARSIIKREKVFEEVRDAAREGWDIIASGGLTTTYSCIKRLGKELRPICPDAILLVGGNLITTLPNEIMSWLKEWDICAVGDAWETIGEIVHRCMDREWSKVLGLGWRKPDGHVEFNALRPPIANVDTLPFPAWDLVPMDIYFKNSAILLSEAAWQARKRIGLATSYGCPLRCEFCVNESIIGEMSWKESEHWKRDIDFSWKGKHVYHYHSPEYIVKEIRTAEELLWDVEPRGPIDYLDFADENFLTTHDISPGRRRIFELRDAWLAAGFQPQCIKQGIDHNPAKCSGKHITSTSHAGRVRPELLEAMRDMGMCVVGDADVMCNPHPQAIATVAQGDKVLTFGGKYANVLRSAKREYDGLIIKIRPYGGAGSRLTPEHPVLVIRDEDFEIYRDKNLGFPKHYRRVETRKRATIKDAGWLPAGQLRKGDFLVYPIPRFDPTNSQSLEPGLARLAGYYLAEGSVSYLRGKPNRVEFDFSSTEQDYVDDVDRLMFQFFGVHPWIQTRSATHSIRLASSKRKVTDFFANFGRGCTSKHVPEIILKNLSVAARAQLIRGYWRGDGHVTPIGFGFTTVSKTLAFQTKNILLSLNVISGITRPKTYSPRIIAGNQVKKLQQSYLVLVSAAVSPSICDILSLQHAALSARIRSVKYSFIRDGYLFTPIKKISTESYRGTVYDIQVESAHAFALADNMLIHNSVLDYGIESFASENMKETRKGSTPLLNIRALRMTAAFGIRGVPNQIMGFPTESFKTIRDNVAAWAEIGVIVYPFCLTPFPGSGYFLRYRRQIEDQYGGDLELFIEDLGDCTKPTATVCDFTVEELIKLREWMVKGERECIDKYENVWRGRRGLPPLSPEQQQIEWHEAEKRAADPRGKWPPETVAPPLQPIYKPEHVKIRDF